MQNIVLITRENGERVTHASVFLCNLYNEASLFCGFINNLLLSGGERFYARCVLLGNEYALDKRTPPVFEDILHFDDRKIQRIMREIDASVLARALSNSDEEVKDKYFRNMSKRAASMLKEDIEFMGPVDKVNSDIAKNAITDVYESVNVMEGNEKIKSAFAGFSKKPADFKEKEDVFWTDYDKDKAYIVLVMRGADDIAERISVMLFDTEESANNFCEFINKLKPANGFFVYARRTEQMVEYEIEKPLLVQFDKIFDYREGVLGQALAEVGWKTVIRAMKGLDPRSKEKILLAVPEWMEEKILTELEQIKENSKEYKFSFNSMTGTKLAQQQIVNVMIAIDRKNRKNNTGPYGMILKD
jgi:hypothetical protein